MGEFDIVLLDSNNIVFTNHRFICSGYNSAGTTELRRGGAGGAYTPSASSQNGLFSTLVSREF